MTEHVCNAMNYLRCFRPSAETDKVITLDQLYLLDSGAQYR